VPLASIGAVPSDHGDRDRGSTVVESLQRLEIEPDEPS
jgi:hypothetical protein